jgi:hypothetical protein
MKIYRISDARKASSLVKKSKVCKFEARAERFMSLLGCVFKRDLCQAFNTIKLAGLGVSGSNSKLQKIKQLKSKIQTQATKIESKLLKSSSSKGKVLTEHINREKVGNLFSKKRGSLIENSFGFVNKELPEAEEWIEKENELLEIKLRATEDYIYNFIKEANDQIDFLHISKPKRSL